MTDPGIDAKFYDNVNLINTHFYLFLIFLHIIVGSMAVCGIAKSNIGRHLKSRIVFFTDLVQIIILVILDYPTPCELYLLNGLSAIEVPDTTFVLSTCITLFVRFFVGNRRGLDEAALIDACSKHSAFRYGLFPLATPDL